MCPVDMRGGGSLSLVISDSDSDDSDLPLSSVSDAVTAGERVQEARALQAERKLREREKEKREIEVERDAAKAERDAATVQRNAVQAECDAVKAEAARLRGRDIGNLSEEELEKLKSDIKSALEEGMRNVNVEVERRLAAKAIEETNKSYVCPLSHVLMRDPVQAADGYTYERAIIEEWIRRKQAEGSTARSPSTNEPLANTRLMPNHTLKSAICQAVDVELARMKRAREEAEGEGDGGESARPASKPRTVKG